MGRTSARMSRMVGDHGDTCERPYAVEPRKLPSGRWKGRVVRYGPDTGKRIERNRTFETKKEAKNLAERDCTVPANEQQNPCGVLESLASRQCSRHSEDDREHKSAADKAKDWILGFLALGP